MVSTILTVLITLLSVAGLGLFIWLLTVMFGRDEEKDTRPIMLNFDAKHAHGRFLGTVQDIVWGAGGRGKVTYEPKDVDLRKLKRSKQKLTPEEIIIAPHRYIALPEGSSLSADRALIINLPANPDHLDEALKHSPLGLAIQFLTVQQDFVKKRIELLKDKIKDRDALLNEVGDAEMSEELISRLKGFNKDLAEMVLEMKDSKKRFDYSAGTGAPPRG